MAFHVVKNVKISGVSACVPKVREDNKSLSLFQRQEESWKFIETTGVEYRHVVKNSGICTSDMCYSAALHLIDKLNWKAEEIDCLIFVSQTPDYILPATSCVLQERLKLPTGTYALDISLGCSGWVYGLSVISSLISGGTMKKGILLAGDTTTVTKSPKDRSTYPLFGDAGTATAVEFDKDSEDIMFNFGTDGKGYDAIIIPDGGFRSFFNIRSLEEFETEPGISRNKLQSILKGPEVFTFGISKAPKSVNAILEHYEIEKEDIDYFIFHQANLMMNEKIRTKLKIEPYKVPYSLREFGNTSSASIPLTIVTQIRNEINHKKILACAFGVGLSWASVIFCTMKIKCPELIEI